MKKKVRSLALFMTFVLLFSSVSFAVSAESAPAASTPTRLTEVEALRETNSETYLMSDGSYECVVYAYNKYYRTADSSLQPTSNKIVPAAAAERSGKLSADKAQYKNEANAFDVHFSADGTPQISVAYQGASLTFSPVVPLGTSSQQSADFSVGKVTACKTLSDLTYTGDNTVTYSNAFPNTDLVYVLENDVLKEYIILNNANASNIFRFSFALDGVTLQSKDKYADFVDKNGIPVFSLDTLFATDSNGAFTEALTYSFAPVEGTNKVTVTITLDSAYLSHADRVFPVVIDPSIMISSIETADAFVASAAPNTNYRYTTELRTGKDTTYGVRRSYIKFNIPSTIPANCVTRSYLQVEKSSGVDPTIYACIVRDSWSSATITWNNKASYTMVNASSTSVPYAEGSTWHKMDVTSIVQAWLSGAYPDYGFVLLDETENSTSHWTTLYSSDASSPHKPELHIWYTDPGSGPVPFRSIRLYGVNITDHVHEATYDHHASLRNAKNLLESHGYTDVALLTGYFEPETFKDQLKAATIVTTFSHGYTHKVNGNVYATGLQLNSSTDGNNSNTDDLWLFMNKNCSMPSDKFTYIKNSDDFSALELGVFVGCETAKSASDGTNFAKDIADRGAYVTIGFSTNILCAEAIDWITLFYDRLLDGFTVNEAADWAADNAEHGDTTQSYCVYGNGNSVLVRPS